MSSPIDLKELAVRESEQVEWKENVADVDDVVATLCAFANDLANLGGGRVVCGARESKDEYGFPRLELTGLAANQLKEIEGKVLTRCRERVSPPIAPRVDELEAATAERRILVFTIPSTSELHLFRRGDEGGKYFVRISRETREARNGLLRDLLDRNRGPEAWDRRPCIQATAEDIDLLVLREALQRLGLQRSGNGEVEAYLSATVPLSSFVPPLLVREPLTGILRPRNFAILLFGHRVQLFIPGAISFFSAYQGTNRSVSLGHRTELDGNLLSQVSRMLPLVEAQAATLYDKENLEQPSVQRYPQRALREALVNAFAHRDYQRVEPLRVTAFADRMEFNSPGSLLPGISLEKLRRGEVGAIWRNQTLAWFFNRLRLAEAEGQGIETIHESMRQEGCPPPEFEADEIRVLCTLRAHTRVNAAGKPADEPLWPMFAVPFPSNRYFTGRGEVLARIARELAASGRAAITGLGGIGKTQTAVEFAYRRQKDYRAVFFVPSDTRGNLVAGFAAMAEKLRLSEAAGQDQGAAAQAARRWLDTNEGWLLILDDADDPALLGPFLPAAGKGHVLITSRAPNLSTLHVVSERLAPLSNEEAIDFLLWRTDRRRISSEVQAAQELAEELGRLPLALEQAAAYMVSREVSLADYLESYRERGIELLGRSGPQVGTQHDPVAITWSLSLQKIETESPASIDLLRAAAFLAPDAIPEEFFLEGAREISATLEAAMKTQGRLAVAELATPLLRYSLIERDSGSRTLSLHPLLQEVVKQGLGEAGREMLRRVVKAMRRAFPWPDFAAWPRCERLVPHLLAVAKVAEASEELAWLLAAGAEYLKNRARFSEAELLYKRSLAIRERSLGRENPGVAASLNNLARLYLDQGRLGEAEPLLERSLKIREKLLEGGDPDVAQSLDNLATLYREQGRFAQAEPLYGRSLAIRERSLGGDHPDVAQSLNNLSSLYRVQGRFVEREPLLKRSLAIREKALGGDHPDVATSLTDLGLLYSDENRLAEAEPLFQRALANWERALGGDHPNVATALMNLARLRHEQGRDAEAEDLAARAREVRKRHEARNRPPPQP